MSSLSAVRSDDIMANTNGCATGGKTARSVCSSIDDVHAKTAEFSYFDGFLCYSSHRDNLDTGINKGMLSQVMLSLSLYFFSCIFFLH